MTDPTTARFARSTLGEPAVPAMSYPIMVDGAQVGWSASCYEIARSLATELVVALEAERDDLRARLAVALDGCCPDCGGSGIGSDACDGPGHHTPPCPSCEGSGLAPGARRMAAQRNAAWAERDAAQARVAELEAPGECASIHKLRAQVTDLQAAVERVRPVVEVLAGACHSAVRGEVATISRLVIGLGRGNSTFYDTAAWLHSLLSTAPDSAHRPTHTDLMVAPESVLDLAPTECPACRGSGWGDAREIATCVVCRGSGLAPQSEPLAEHEPDESKGTRWESPPQSAPAPDGRFTVDSAWRFK